MESAKIEIRFDVYPVGLRFWIMNENRPTEAIIRSFEIGVFIDQETGSQSRIRYIIDRYNPSSKDGCGSLLYYTSFDGGEKEPYLTREKLIASLF